MAYLVNPYWHTWWILIGIPGEILATRWGLSGIPGEALVADLVTTLWHTQ